MRLNGNGVATARERWVDLNRAYYRAVASFLRRRIPRGSRVLQLGSDVGQFISELEEPARALGVEAEHELVIAASRAHPHVEFRAERPERFSSNERFDYVVLADRIGSSPDLHALLEHAHQALLPNGRLIITYYNYLWEPLLRLAEFFHQKMRQTAQNWLPLAGLDVLLELSDFDPVSRGHFLLMPRHIPAVSTFANDVLARLPLIGGLSLVQFVIARPLPRRPAEPRSCSVIVPCRNEAGTIRELVARLPEMGRHTEILFVEGHSTDGTLEACHRVRLEYPNRSIRVLVQPGKGKADAVRTGFRAARGEVLMILDADLAVPPEELPRFHDTLASGKCDLASGTRLMYPMERQAMRFLNLMANRWFGTVLSFLVGQRITDTLCGTKALSRTAYDRIASEQAHLRDADPFGDFELLLGAARLNLKILEIPVHYRARKYGTTNISRFSHGLQLVRMLWLASRGARSER